jgi:hypothetical protein
MVNPEVVIEPYDVHIDDYPKLVEKNWYYTALNLLGGNQYDILILYRGGCPDSYIPVLRPILHGLNISLITFGRPNMYDIGKLGEFTNRIINGTTYEGLKSILRFPAELKFYPR